jgi:hypothetical protein
MSYRRSSLSIVLHSITGFIVLIVLLIIANVLISSINNIVYTNIVQFFNSLLGLFVILFLIGMLNGIFWSFEFPLNLLAPISSGVLGIFIVNLVYKLLEFAQTFVYFDTLAKILSHNIYPIVFFVTIIIGYLIIINEEYRRTGRNSREERKPKEYVNRKDMDNMKSKIEDKKLEEKKSYKSEFSWEEVGDEFKKASLNVGKALNKAFEGKKEKDNKNKTITKKKIKKKK